MKELTLIIPAKEESNSLPKVLEEVKNLELKKLIVLAENDYETINFFNSKFFTSSKTFGSELLSSFAGIINVSSFTIFLYRLIYR